MQIKCPKCNSSLLDSRGGGILIKCPKCGLDGDLGFELSYLKNEYEIENRLGTPMFWYKRD